MPLVVDQPEDEADKDYLLTYLIPALRRLKGKRQVIFATHDANIVVNGDADHVVSRARYQAHPQCYPASSAWNPPINGLSRFSQLTDVSGVPQRRPPL